MPEELRFWVYQSCIFDKGGCLQMFNFNNLYKQIIW